MREPKVAYREAAKVDKFINKLLLRRPLRFNREFWTVFVRTVGTTLNALTIEMEKRNENE